MSELHDKIRMAQVTAAEMVVLQDMHDKGLCADYCPACKQEDAPSHPQDPAHAILAELAQITCLSLPQQIEQAAFDLSDRAKALLSTSPPQDPRDALCEWFNSLPCDGIGKEHWEELQQIVSARDEVIRVARDLLAWDAKYPKGRVYNYGEHNKCESELTAIVERFRLIKLMGEK